METRGRWTNNTLWRREVPAGRGWRRTNLGGRRHGRGGGEIAIVACLCFVEETNLVLLVDLVEGDTWLRLAWWAGMGLLGLVGWELIHVSTELICVQYRLVKVRMASPRRLGGWKGVERLASPRLVALKTMRQTFA
jgi:hypothetical protein